MLVTPADVCLGIRYDILARRKHAKRKPLNFGNEYKQKTRGLKAGSSNDRNVSKNFYLKC